MVIKAGGRCPKALHDKWVARHSDRSDPQTQHLSFKTYHPLWDPCFFCSYGHEHGSNAPDLMGYHPTYGYTALKNYKQAESHNGFKDAVVNLPTHWLYISVHAQLSLMGRFRTRNHTMVWVARNKAPGQIDAELSFKGDFGDLLVRAKNGTRVPVFPDAKRVGDEHHSRLTNILDPENRDRRWEYRQGKKLRQGQYEQWRTIPMCASLEKKGEFRIDFRDPILAMRRTRDADPTKGPGRTWLRQKRGNGLTVSPGVNREIRVKKLIIGASECGFNVPGGRFYTDPYGKELKKGPGKNSIAQFIRKGFRLVVDGDFLPEETWLGLYEKDGEGRLINIGGGIDETKN